MILAENAVLFLIAAAGGSVIASGVFALITMLGIIPRLASYTGTAGKIALYENAVIWGGILGNLVSVFEWRVPIGQVGLLMAGIFWGIYVGCYAMALAEVLKVIPILTMRVKLTHGIPFVVLAIAAGKVCGSLWQMFFP